MRKCVNSGVHECMSYARRTNQKLKVIFFVRTIDASENDLVIKVGLYGIRLVRILCDPTPAVMLSPPGYVRTMPIFEKLPANAMRHAGNPPATGLQPAVTCIVSAGVASA